MGVVGKELRDIEIGLCSKPRKGIDFFFFFFLRERKKAKDIARPREKQHLHGPYMGVRLN